MRRVALAIARVLFVSASQRAQTADEIGEEIDR